MGSTWQETAASVQEELKCKIPKQWRLPDSLLVSKPRNVLPLIGSCGLLTSMELVITESEDATTILANMHSKEWSALEVTIAFCKRAAIAQQLVNCLMDVDFEGAMQRAQELDEYLQTAGQIFGPLHGLPISLKDLTQVCGMRLSIGLTALARYMPQQDALAIKMLRQAGAIVYVKTTMPQTGMVGFRDNFQSFWTLNPYNTDVVSGGSSGGEAALNACRGAPIGIATDIGGSIRAPASFDGLYGIRPTSRRVSYMGHAFGFTGQAAILSTIGPVGRSLRDVELIMRTWTDMEPWLHDPAVMAKKWEPVPTPSKAVIGVMYRDEVVMPHPPIQRALKEVVQKLKAAGHETVDFKPYKQKEAWELAFKLYFMDGGNITKDILEKAGEPVIPSVGKFWEVTQELDIHSLIECNKEQRQYQIDYLAHWNATATQTSTGRPIDALLMPSMASASFPHDYQPWWGYLSLWNLLDYPAVILPVTSVQPTDLKDDSYTPINEKDRETYDIYDPDLFADVPVSLQLVGRSMLEEQLLAVAMATDKAAREY